MMGQQTVIKFEEALDEDDWGLIIGKDGTLKGMFVPEGQEDADVPHVIVKLCTDFFGIDPTEEVTLH